MKRLFLWYLCAEEFSVLKDSSMRQQCCSRNKTLHLCSEETLKGTEIFKFQQNKCLPSVRTIMSSSSFICLSLNIKITKCRFQLQISKPQKWWDKRIELNIFASFKVQIFKTINHQFILLWTEAASSMMLQISTFVSNCKWILLSKRRNKET